LVLDVKKELFGKERVVAGSWVQEARWKERGSDFIQRSCSESGSRPGGKMGVMMNARLALLVLSY
jgi:hypothetical protein